jgi:hypothetical protein
MNEDKLQTMVVLLQMLTTMSVEQLGLSKELISQPSANAEDTLLALEKTIFSP